ncbi:MAG: hypothetical protein JETCAE03_34970 [Ignavibacteriaceae bacterium]|jgi:hypothetical protein|nr:MAG: hypothetical protein JETCAE03_34970 [Ignavibacteriaceae bacterium]
MFNLLAVIAQVLPSEVIALLAPIVVFAATQFVKWVLPKLDGWIIVTIIVPLLSVIAAWLAQLIVPVAFWPQVLLGLLAVFVAELIKQLGQLVTKKS